MSRQLVKHLALLLLLCTAASLVRAQGDTPANEKVIEYLRNDREVKGDNDEYTFTGDFIPIMDYLQKALSEELPDYKFSVARMKACSDGPCRPANLVVISDAKSGEVLGFFRPLSLGVGSRSFKTLFTGHKLRSEEDALLFMQLLGALIAFADDGTSCHAHTRPHAVRIIFDCGGVESFRILEAKLDKSLTVKQMAVIDGRTGKRLEPR